MAQDREKGLSINNNTQSEVVAWAGGTLTTGSDRARRMYESLSAMPGSAD